MNAPADEQMASRYRITADDVIEFVNATWMRFAEENGTPALPQEVIGKSLWQHITGQEVGHLYRQLIRKVRETKTELSVPFRCDSPAQRRYMRLKIVPLPQGKIEFSTWVEREEPNTRPIRLLDPTVVKDRTNHLRMCVVQEDQNRRFLAGTRRRRGKTAIVRSFADT